jgi:hypothetical protein
MPQVSHFAPALGRRNAVPFRPLFSNQFFHGKHVDMMPESEPPLKQRIVAEKPKAPGLIPGAFNF